LYVTNTFIKHRRSQVLTWYKWNNLDQASQIDYILARRPMRRLVTDSKAMPNIQMDTDHRPVMLEMKTSLPPRARKSEIVIEHINLKKLDDATICQKIQADMDSKFNNLSKETRTPEEEWECYRLSLTDSLKSRCGTKKSGKGVKKGTAWWNETVKDAIKNKKSLFKQWSKSKNKNDYENYRQARKECKKVVKKAKDESWKEYGEQLA